MTTPIYDYEVAKNLTENEKNRLICVLVNTPPNTVCRVQSCLVSCVLI
jgi:hypothetical protein